MRLSAQTGRDRRAWGLLRRFGKRQEGAAAVEFALVALPFFGLVIAVIELAVYFFAARFLEDGLFNASRKVLTNRLDTASICTTFPAAVKQELAAWFSPSKLTITVTPLTSFSATGTAVDLAGGGCTFGASGQTMVIRASYAYPFQGFRFVAGGTAMGKGYALTAATAFQVE
jgi:Flp pilus assembly protein TadG